MPKRSAKRRLNGVKMRRYHLCVVDEVGELFERIAGDVSYNVAFEEMTKYFARKKEKHEQKVCSTSELSC